MLGLVFWDFLGTATSVSIYRLISMYNGSDRNTSAHTRFAKPLETRRTSHYPETNSIIHYISPTWSAKLWNLSLTVPSRGQLQVHCAQCWPKKCASSKSPGER